MTALHPAERFFALAHRHAWRGKLAVLLTAALLLVICFVAVQGGAVAIDPLRALEIFGARLGFVAVDPAAQSLSTILLDIRLPRVALGILTGAGLAVSGVTLQGLFRNPLADPGLVGVSTGAALAAAAFIVLGRAAIPYLPGEVLRHALPLAAFGGGLAATVIVYLVATRDGRTDVATLLLSGVAINAMAAAGIGLLTFLSSEQELRDLNFWMLGSLNGVTWLRLSVAAPLIVIPTLALLQFARHLNALLLGETEARHLGFRVEGMKRLMVGLVALNVGAIVALTGAIGFVGLVVPHLVRLVLGADHRILLPVSALLGGALVLVADLVARTIVAPAELPIGILTAMFGGPFFLWLLLRQREQGNA